MLIVGEKINVMSTEIGKAMKARDAGPIQKLAKEQVDAGANYLDINIGPAAKDGAAMMEWLVKTVHEAVDVPLSLDTTNPEAMEAGLKAHEGQALVNSISGKRERMEQLLPLVKEYDAKVIGLTMTEAGVPRDANERAATAVDILTEVVAAGVSPENLYLDPLALPMSVAQQDTKEVFEALKLFKELHDPAPKAIIGLSNISNSAPSDVKPLLDRVFLTLLMAAGLDGAILDPLDRDLIETLKTVRLFQNEVLYAGSYLEE
ncbi:MAG: dihydropteroate synthase [Terriglobia bacterium]